MLVSMKAGIAYLAMPKTGSTAIEAALAPGCDIVMSGHPNLKHMRLRRFERQIRPILPPGDVATVAVIREPLEWLGSWYRYRARPQLQGQRNSTSDLSFDAFVEAWLQDDPPSYARVGRPVEFLEPPQSSLGIDHLFRYDAFDALAEFLAQRFGRPIAFETLNVSPAMELTLSPALRRETIDRMAVEYTLYEGALCRSRDASIDRLT
ncbi:gamma-glutamyl kinase [Pontivivens nitratireducens]|uniref:Gamma-glutamyl kinase n=1 Tax=Pontivivens nitratireducens TaxID=2758038 RepID=A0A6G7VMK0_9RHOB|nr:gamma-glutamyl kinase [Pontibrevibacter nitratireducens]QIK41078.1 gamma-glutamyl kinase [Pontibrevibacter nitratireducens]